MGNGSKKCENAKGIHDERMNEKVHNKKRKRKRKKRNSNYGNSVWKNNCATHCACVICQSDGFTGAPSPPPLPRGGNENERFSVKTNNKFV